MKRTPNVALIGIMLAALVTIAVVAFTAWTRLAKPENVTAEGNGFSTAVRIGGPFALTNHFGEKVTNETYHGRFLFVYFGYGYCPDICPTELANM
ncbi:MAG: SCO family protein, partial [Pseudomonadota bacterium]|nr:SCO family protein [Pseudomonadota bacterium]